MAVTLETTMSLFWPIFGIENWFVRSFSATTRESGPLIAYADYTHHALSTDICHPVSPPFMDGLDENRTNRDFSPRSDKTRLNSSVYEMHEVRYSADTVVVFHLHFAVLLGRAKNLRGRDFCPGVKGGQRR